MPLHLLVGIVVPLVTKPTAALLAVRLLPGICSSILVCRAKSTTAAGRGDREEKQAMGRLTSPTAAA